MAESVMISKSQTLVKCHSVYVYVSCMCVLYMYLNYNVVSLYKYAARLSSVFMFIYIFWPYMSRMHLNVVPVIRMWMFFACVAIFCWIVL